MKRKDCRHFTRHVTYFRSTGTMSLPTTPSGRRQNSPTYLPLLIADRRQAIFGHIRRLLEDTPAHIAVNHTISVLRGVQPVPGWKRPLRCLQKTSLQQVEADHGMDADVSRSHAQDRDCVDIATFDPRWSDAAVSDWVFSFTYSSHTLSTLSCLSFTRFSLTTSENTRI